MVGGGGAEVGEGVEVGVGVVAGAGDGAEKEPLAFSRGDECHCPSKSGLGFFGLGGCVKSHDGLAHGSGFVSSSGALFAGAQRWGFGERACAVRCWGMLRSGRTLRGSAGAWQGSDHRLARRLRQAPLAGHVGAARALHLLRPIRVGTLGTFEPEKAAVRARRAPIAAQGRPPDMMRLPHDAGRPPRGAHAVRAA